MIGDRKGPILVSAKRTDLFVGFRFELTDSFVGRRCKQKFAPGGQLEDFATKANIRGFLGIGDLPPVDLFVVSTRKHFLTVWMEHDAFDRLSMAGIRHQQLARLGI